MVRIMTEAEAERRVIALLARAGKLTTQEIESAMQAENVRCPDAPVRFLSKLRAQGKIKGEVSVERRGWVWWV